uniref:HDC10120 n=1 Tax=Drosophila melanogaster TaxID=7227 RepID=Q6IL77_DROME|nr:TPA_inf: HDC10120 [Drosophila melanogaster]
MAQLLTGAREDLLVKKTHRLGVYFTCLYHPRFLGNINLGLGLSLSSICGLTASEVRRLPMGISPDGLAQDQSSS